ncbi:MAG: YSIRK signal domain/LPXTG anchor domain surface protein, partial [Desulfobacteraceae bacterium]|nr:YSIRK signal domain/LPXTG anchor domain surface protein [Desulfobacteraceae bacterium]
KYEFPNLPPGDYRVVVDTDSLPDGVTPIADADGVLDSRTDALNQTSDNPNLDFGYMKGGVAASLGDIVWYDADADGIQDSGEAGVPGVTVKLYNASGAVIGTTSTDSTGYYRFDNLAPGSYSVEFVRPDGYSFSPKNQGGDSAKDSNADTATGKLP